MPFAASGFVGAYTFPLSVVVWPASHLGICGHRFTQSPPPSFAFESPHWLATPPPPHPAVGAPPPAVWGGWRRPRSSVLRPPSPVSPPEIPWPAVALGLGVRWSTPPPTKPPSTSFFAPQPFAWPPPPHVVPAGQLPPHETV